MGRGQASRPAPAVGRERARRLRPEQAPRAELAIDDLDHEGRGIGRVEGKVVFVDGALPGERVRARYTRTGRRFDEAVVERVLVPAAARVEPFCPVFGRCGGCTLQHLGGPARRTQHETRVAHELARAAGAPPDTWLDPLTGPERGYRVRARLGVRHVAGRGILMGFRERDGRYIADTDCCGVLDPRLEALIVPLKSALGELSRPARVRAVEATASDGDTAMTLQLGGEPTDADRARLRRFQADSGAVVETRVRDAAPVPVDRDRPPDLHYRLPADGLTLHFGSGEFTQANAVVNRALVERALALLAPVPGGRVVDLYSGIGNFALPAAARGAQVTGIDGDAALVARASANAGANGLDGQAAFRTLDLAAAGPGAWLDADRPDAVLLDPPRGGARGVASALAAARPPRIVYVSCDPPTLARDIGILVDQGGYRLRAAGIADMFPHTGHVEALACLETTAAAHPYLDAPGSG